MTGYTFFIRPVRNSDNGVIKNTTNIVVGHDGKYTPCLLITHVKTKLIDTYYVYKDIQESEEISFDSLSDFQKSQFLANKHLLD